MSAPAASSAVAPVVTLGETMALFSASRPGPLETGGSLELGIGGSESNVAIGLARLGVPVTWVGRVGDDALGRLVVRTIRGEGVEVRHLLDDVAPTGLMVKERRTSATQAVSYYRSASAGSRLSPADLDEGLVATAALLHVTGITPALSTSARDAVRTAVAVARAAGVPVSLDLNYRSALWGPADARAWYAETLPSVDLVFAGRDEAGIAVGERSDAGELARALVDAGAGSAVVKLGEQGALALDGGVLVHAPAARISPVDTVGAGDAFVAGYLAEQVAGLPVARRLETGNLAGAFACLVPGDWEGFPRRPEFGLLGSTEPVHR